MQLLDEIKLTNLLSFGPDTQPLHLGPLNVLIGPKTSTPRSPTWATCSRGSGSSETPDAVIVCEKHDGATHLTRLDAEKLRPWLTKYRLGEIWTRGEIGGTRW
ncbi:MAG: hypothetical protein HY719_10830 [Planctomycetes bacterium]|nr:hypothetical protein [Planctomycetota bacterium]